jgi:hypothetical protein
MDEQLYNLIEALREELKQYGEMLALLDQEQKLIMHRETFGIPPCVASINAHAEMLGAVRHERDQRWRQMARSLHLSEDISLKELVSRLPLHYQPLVLALVQENKELKRRVQQRATQNHLLLSQMVEFMQKLIA